MSTNDRPVVLLDDGPTTTDDFGGHERVASAIANTIATDEHGKAIALEGTWGSGKSSVIRMLDAKLRASTSVQSLVFSFDAWCHQQDPLRRAFLRELFSALKDRGFIPAGSEHALKERVEGLRAREITTSLALASPIRLKRLYIALTINLAIIALAVLSSGPTEHWWWWLLGAVSPLMAWGALFPMHWIARAFSIYGRPKLPRDTWLRRFLVTFCWINHDSPTSLLPSLDGNREQLDDTAIHTRDRTSLDFREVFVSVVGAALHEHDRRLVIVMDNLDRLPSAEARAIWSTLRVFAEALGPPSSSTDWRKRVWLIVPFDRSALSAMWRSYSPADTTEPESVANVEHDVAMSFLDKTFAVRFDVPPLLVVDWRNALMRWLQAALPGWDIRPELDYVYRLSLGFAESRGHPPTPRHLKLFVNDVAALLQQHGPSRFRLRTLAHYALKRRAGWSPEDIRLKLRDGSLLQSAEREMLGDIGIEELACLVFVTHDAGKARELLLRPELVASLKRADGKVLSQLMGSPAFVPCIPFLRDWLREDLGKEQESTGNALIALYSADVPTEAPESLRDEMRELASSVLRAMECSTISADTGRYLASAVRTCRNEATVRLASQKLTGLSFTAEQAKHVAISLSQIAEAVAATGLQSAVASPIHLRGDGNAIAVLASELAGPGADSKWLWPHLSLDTKADDLQRVVWPDPTQTPWDERWANALAVLMACGQTGIQWAALPARCVEALSHKSDSPGHVKRVLSFLRHVATLAKDESTTHRRSIVDNGRLHNHLHYAFEQNDWSSAADLVLEVTLWRPVSWSPPAWAQSASGHHRMIAFVNNPSAQSDLLKSVVQHADQDLLATWIRNALERGDAETLLRAMLERFAADGRLAQLLPASTIVNQWSRIAALFGDAADGVAARRALIGSACKTGGLPETVSSGFDPARASLYVDVLLGGSTEQAFMTLLEDALAKRSQEEWSNALRDKDAMLELLWQVRKARSGFRLGAAYEQALDALGKRLLEPTAASTYRAEDSENLLGALKPEGRPVLIKNLRDYAHQPDAVLSDGFLDVFGTDFGVLLRDNPDERDVRRIVKRAFTHGSSRAIQFAASVVSDKPSLVKKAPKEDRDDFTTTLKEYAGAAEESVRRESARTACEALDIEYKSRNKD